MTVNDDPIDKMMNELMTDFGLSLLSLGKWLDEMMAPIIRATIHFVDDVDRTMHPEQWKRRHLNAARRRARLSTQTPRKRHTT